MDLLLECPDSLARLNIANLLKYILKQLKLLEKDTIVKELENANTIE